MEESLASPIVSQDAIEALTKYAVRFHEAMGTGHAAASPLGAYLLLAAVAPPPLVMPGAMSWSVSSVARSMSPRGFWPISFPDPIR
jgi:hypothetical protein